VSDSSSELFELERPLPDADLEALGDRLIGFRARFGPLERAFDLLLEPKSLTAWAEKHHGKGLRIVEILAERYPLVILHGDVGTGKTAFAEAAAARMSRQPGPEGTLMKLSTRVRGVGKVGELSHLINDAFDAVEVAIGRERRVFLIIDEADSLAASRGAEHSHHEDKAGVNTLIQKIDDSRRHKGRLLVFLATNRLTTIDPALVRRAAHIEHFRRPDDRERLELLEYDTEGLGVADVDLAEVVKLTAPGGGQPGFTFSDLRTRLVPDAVLRAYPDRGLTAADLVAAAAELEPSPSVEVEG
jgi:SpoVK/Ycf46/Vps4 family AAA+-type ATPase